MSRPDTPLNRRETLCLAGLAALAATGAKAADLSPEPIDAADLAATDLVGYVLRVVGPNEAVTQDYNPGRVTIVIDANKQITDIRIG